MKSRIRFKEKTFHVQSSRWFYWVMTIVGIVMFGWGLLTLADRSSLNHMLISSGLVIAATGMWFFVNSKYYKVLINPEQPEFIDMIESSNITITPVKIPARYYSAIGIQKRVSLSRSKKLSVCHMVMLMSDFGSSMFVNEFAGIEDAREFAGKLKDMLGLDVVENYNPFEGDRHERARREFRINSMTFMGIPLPDRSRVYHVSTGFSSTLIWKSGYNFFHYFLILCIIYGIYHAGIFVLYPVAGPALPLSVITWIAVILLCVLFYFMLKNIFDRCVLEISPNGISFCRQFAGRRYAEKEMKRNEIGLVRNSVNTGRESICILSMQGLELINSINARVSGDGEHAAGSTLVEDYNALQEEIIELDVSPLSMKEKLFIEEVIISKTE